MLATAVMQVQTMQPFSSKAAAVQRITQGS
jgi:hypothetical protein